ncbi:MAG: transglycosylase SLT domain-containing protein [Parvibaculaceae bacterium]|jgi:soluble lytic murein transglycosylase-like protein
MRLKILAFLLCLGLIPPAAMAATPEELDGLIAKYAATYNVPETLIRRIIKRESNYDPSAYSRGHWGLMQIKHQTAQSMGYRGSAKGLLDAETNLIYGVKYLAGAYLVADGNEARAVRFYSSGYYYDAKRKGLLDETGLGRDRKARHKKKSKRLTNVKNFK